MTMMERFSRERWTILSTLFSVQPPEASSLDCFRIDRDDTESGIYLRWIDRHGFIRDWLFAAGGGNEGDSQRPEVSYANNLADYPYGHYGDHGRRQGYERMDSIKLCARLVDSDTSDML